jgi:hypothetical protein
MLMTRWNLALLQMLPTTTAEGKGKAAEQATAHP